MTTPSASLSTTAQHRADLHRELRRAVRILGGVLLVLWAVLLVDVLVFGGRLREYGITPRSVAGLRGILYMPFLHAGFMHLLGNSLGLVMLGGLVLAREEHYFWIVSAFGMLVGGLGVWLVGHGGTHIGFSGVVFAYFGYLLLAGLFERRLLSIVLSTFVAFVWGSLIYGVLPGQPGISWEGHLFGFIGGALAARLLARRSATR